MNPRRSFERKIVYMATIAVLLTLLYRLGTPSTGVVEEIDGVRQVVRGDPGGKLAQLRTEYGLSEAQFGDIDPVSETMKLATFGLRGVATNILWRKAFSYQKKKDWTNLSATLNQIAKLEPHFIIVWKYQAWNLSFNVSAEFDDFRQRYYWVIEGIKFVKRGVALNRHEPQLLWDVGWFTGQKIGRADEAKQFRILFREDDDFHAEDEEYGGSRPVEKRDNWLVGKYWFGRGESLVDNEGVSLKKTAPVIFFSHRPMCQMNYSEFLEKDGTFGEKARLAWYFASRDWLEYGSRDLPAGKDKLIRLNDEEMHRRTIADLNQELDKMAPGVRESIYQNKRTFLTEVQRESLDLPQSEWTSEHYGAVYAARGAVRVTPQEVARRITGPDRKKATEMAERIKATEELVRLIDGDRKIVNFEYWRRQAEVEQTPQLLAAREAVYQGKMAIKKDADLISAKEYYDAGFAKWRELLDLDEFSYMITDGHTRDDLEEIIDDYRKLLEKRDDPFPEDFILKDMIDP